MMQKVECVTEVPLLPLGGFSVSLGSAVALAAQTLRVAGTGGQGSSALLGCVHSRG